MDIPFLIMAVGYIAVLAPFFLDFDKVASKTNALLRHLYDNTINILENGKHERQ